MRGRLLLACAVFLVGSLGPAVHFTSRLLPTSRADDRTAVDDALSVPAVLPRAPQASVFDPSAGAEGSPVRVRSSQSAQGNLVNALTGPVTPDQLSGLMADFYRSSGFDLATGIDFGGFEANSTLSFSYDVGDANQDGTGDLVMNTYCVDVDSCKVLVDNKFPPAPNVPPPATATAGHDRCNYDAGRWPASTPMGFAPRAGFAYPQRLYGVNGNNGSMMWQLNMSRLDWNLTSTDFSRVNDVAADPSDPQRIVFDDARINFLAHHAYMMCPVDFVVGTIPNGTVGRDVLVYRYVIDNTCVGPGVTPASPILAGFPTLFLANGILFFPHCDLLILHELRAIDRATGHTHWTRYDVGLVTASHDYTTYCLDLIFTCPPSPTTRAYVVKAVDVTVNPILEEPLRGGAPIVRRSETPFLAVQGVGFDLVTSRPTAAIPGAIDDHTILDIYDPHEWTARIDPTTGKDLWRNTAAFTPDSQRSVLPRAYMVAPLADGTVAPPLYPKSTYTPTVPNDVPFGAVTYWGHNPCCFDLTGDGVPDLTFITLEWSKTPVMDAQGPQEIASRLVTFDGATGQPLWSQLVEPGTQRFLHTEMNEGNVCAVGPYPWWSTYRAPSFFCVYYAFQPYAETVGDVNADGRDDVLLHMIYYGETYRHTLSVRDGKDGHELWNLTSDRDVTALVLGDADHDGGNDFLTVQWQDWEFPFDNVYHDSNVTVLPLIVHNGATGAKLWRADTKTFAAPLDLRAMFSAFKTRGLPDINGDGVGDVAIDDPLFMPDLEIVHRQTYLDGASGAALFRFDNVGTFTFLEYAGDVTGDGTDDVALLQGDVVDLWITVYDGAAGQPLWSRRVLTPRGDDYLFALPYLRIHALDVAGSPAQRPAFNFQFEVLSFGSFKLVDSVVPQIMGVDTNGTFAWAIPGVDPELAIAHRRGATTAVEDYHRLVAEAAVPTGFVADTVSVTKAIAPSLGLIGAGVAVGLPLAHFQPWRRWRK